MDLIHISSIIDEIDNGPANGVDTARAGPGPCPHGPHGAGTARFGIFVTTLTTRKIQKRGRFKKGAAMARNIRRTLWDGGHQPKEGTTVVS